MNRCHICQEKRQKRTLNEIKSPHGGLYLICTSCMKFNNRVFELEEELRKVVDRLTALQKRLEDEPWMIRTANEVFAPVYGDLKGARNDIGVLLWREV